MESRQDGDYERKEYFANSAQISTYTIYNEPAVYHGPVEAWYENGKPQVVGYMENGKKHLCWTYFDEDGIETHIYWHHNKKVKFKPEHVEIMKAFIKNTEKTDLDARHRNLTPNHFS